MNARGREPSGILREAGEFAARLLALLDMWVAVSTCRPGVALMVFVREVSIRL